MGPKDRDEDPTGSLVPDTAVPTQSDQLRARLRRSSTANTRAPDERYRIQEALGHGGMGEVIAAHDTVLGRDVAIKRMKSGSPSAIHISRFLREAQIQGRLDHPAIPPVHELARDERGLPYFVMKRLSGLTLTKIIDRIGAGDESVRARFSRQRLLRAFVDVCLAVELAHTRGIIHRDLKPSNIMLGDFGEVYVIDWGVAKIVGDFDPWVRQPEEEMTIAGTVVGTPGYMSPEQRRGEDIDASSDIYGLGCVLFEILACRRIPPNNATSTGPLHPAEYDADVGPELDALVARATDHSPVLRPTARSLGESMQRFLDGDRDIALRKQLAEQHYHRAVSASLDRDADGRRRRVAIQEAARAIALDPTHAVAAHLVSGLMLEPPESLPRELEAELQHETGAEIKRQATIAIGAYCALAAFIPHMIWSGIRSPLQFASFLLLLLLLVGHAALGTRPIKFPRFAVGLSLGLNTLMIALVARMYSPFLLAPGIAALAGVVMMSSPMFRSARTMIAAVCLFSAAVVFPYLLEVTGAADATMTIANDSVTLGHLALHTPPVQTGLGLVGFSIGIIGVATIISWLIATNGAGARRKLQIQTWQLRQLVPETVPTGSRSRKR